MALLLALAGYAVIGAVVAAAFALRGATLLSGQSVSLGGRLLLMPGAAVLWPLVLHRWWQLA